MHLYPRIYILEPFDNKTYVAYMLTYLNESTVISIKNVHLNTLQSEACSIMFMNTPLPTLLLYACNYGIVSVSRLILAGGTMLSRHLLYK